MVLGGEDAAGIDAAVARALQHFVELDYQRPDVRILQFLD